MNLTNLGFDFDPAKVAPPEIVSFSEIPDGVYTVVIEKIEIKQLKTNDGQGLNFYLKIVDGNFANSFIFEFMTLASSDPGKSKIVQFGHAMLAELCRAVDFNVQPIDTDQMIGKILKVEVKRRKDFLNVIRHEKANQPSMQPNLSAMRPAFLNLK